MKRIDYGMLFRLLKKLSKIVRSEIKTPNANAGMRTAGSVTNPVVDISGVEDQLGRFYTVLV